MFGFMKFILLEGSTGGKTKLTCIDLSEQTEKWSYVDKAGKSYGQAVVDSDYVYFNVWDPYKDGYTGKLHKDSGRLIWRVKTEPEIVIAPILIEDVIYISSYTNAITALSRENGEIIFSGIDRADQAHTDLIEYEGAIVYGNEKRELISLSKDGQIDIVSHFNYGVGNPIKVGNELCVMDGNSTLFKLQN